MLEQVALEAEGVVRDAPCGVVDSVDAPEEQAVEGVLRRQDLAVDRLLDEAGAL